MPCYDPREDEERRRISVEHTKKIDNLTRMLCGLMNFTENYVSAHVDITAIYDDVEGLEDWWIDHKKMDKARTRRILTQLECLKTSRSGYEKAIKALDPVAHEDIIENLQDSLDCINDDISDLEDLI